MTTTAHPISGNIVSLEEEQRTEAILATLAGEVAMIGDVSRLVAALDRIDGVQLVEDSNSFRGTLVLRGVHATRLPSDLVAQLVAHAERGGPWIVDTIAEDPALLELERIGIETTVLAQCDLHGSVLAPSDADIDAGAILASDVPVALGVHARRVVVFAGISPALTEATARVSLFPNDPSAIVRLRAANHELALANRRLAEGRLGSHDAAAARAAAALTELSNLRTYARELEERLDSATFHAKQNDELFQDARVQLFAATARVGQLEAELERHRIHPKLAAKRVLGAARNRLLGR